MHDKPAKIPAIIDVEASGLHFDSYPVEIAVISGETLSSWLIARAPGWTYWDPVAEDIHGISREVLREQGMDATRVACELNDLVMKLGGSVYSDAAEWDRDWIRTLFFATGITRDFHVLAIQNLLDDEQQRTFAARRRQLEGSGRYRVHRAGEDCRLIFAAYEWAVSCRRGRPHG